MSKYECQDCGRTYTEEDMDADPQNETGFRSYIHHIHERVGPGEPMPAGQCNNCGALVHEMQEGRNIPAAKSITMFFHCRRCLEEMPAGTSPEKWARLSVGSTDIGLQVWCSRHDFNIIHIDFEGHQHPANLGRLREKGEKLQ